VTPETVDAAPEIGVRNSQPEGIGRVVALGGGLAAWNNLGRNVVFAAVDAAAGVRPVAVFGDTRFPDDDEASQYDLDVHAILDAPDLGLVLVTNHFGTVRGFARRDVAGPAAESVRRVQPTEVGEFVADVERTVVVGGRLVGSAPRCDGAIGVLVSRPLRHGLDAAIAAEPSGERFGEVSALGAVAGSGLAVGGERHVARASVTDGGRGLGRWRWERDVPFRVAALVDDGDVLWAAGPDASDGPTDDYDWEHLHGGGWAALDRDDGSVLASGPLPAGVAWGTGGVAVVPICGRLAVLTRDGAVHVVDPASPAAAPSSAPLAARSLGIAHAALVGGRILAGFNRGGYRLHAWARPSPGPRTA
jgi:hypothetical protein